MVQELAVRVFTHSSDRLAGISGIAAAMQLPQMGDYFAGVWSWNPFLSMAWHGRTSQLLPSEYRAPSWSWVWTFDQLVWHYTTWATDLDGETEEEWTTWDAKWGPRLLDREILNKGTQEKGEVVEGSSITISGFCRRMVFTEQVGSVYNMWGFAANIDWCSDLGTWAHLDWRPNNWSAEARFEREDERGEGEDAQGVRRYLCVQILRERKHRRFNPKVIAMVLEEAAEGAYRRAGIVEFDLEEEEEEKWERRTLRLV